MTDPGQAGRRTRGTIAANLAKALLVVLPLLLAGRPLLAASVDASSLDHKLILGFQGWFHCPNDGAGKGWFHWREGDKPTTDMLPDVTELAPAERCRTSMATADGQPIEVFSDQNAATVDRQFAWMEDYGLDGVALQRFATQLLNPTALASTDRVLKNVRHAAEAHGRVFFVMYDLTGMPQDKLPEVARDWERLRGLTDSPAYLRHRGHPVLGVWGLGFAHQKLTPAAATTLLADLTHVSGPSGVTFLGGVPAGWRTATGDAETDRGWRDVWPKLGVLSPWTIGRYVDRAGADSYRASKLVPDLAEARRIGVDYMPVVFPGASAANVKRARHIDDAAVHNKIPRQCGRFYWRQVVNALSAGATMLYGAMFDEVDEGTAMFKTLASAAGAPTTGVPAGDAFVTLDADGCHLPSDWYLRLAGAATRAVGGGRTPPADLPLTLPSE